MRERKQVAKRNVPGKAAAGTEAIRRLRRELAAARKRLKTVAAAVQAANKERAFLAKEPRSVKEELRIVKAELSSSQVELGAVRERLKTTDRECRRCRLEVLRKNQHLANLGQLSAGIAHEIRNVNNVVLAEAETLREIWADAEKVLRRFQEQRGDFRLGGLSFAADRQQIALLPSRIAACARQIGAIVESLGRFAGRGDPVLDQKVDLRKIIADTITILNHQIKTHTDRFGVDFQGALPQVRGNERALGQVFINLILNALEALPEKSRGVRLSVEHDRDARRVLVRISDEGVGMTEEIAAQAFLPFFTTKHERGGHGLGLSISASILEKHGGSVAFASRPGEGTVATIALPVSRPAAGLRR